MKHYLYLVRHGESKQNTGENTVDRLPDHAIELTDLGVNQASAAGKFLLEYLQNQKVCSLDIEMWASPFKRTRQTAFQVNRYLNVRRIKEDPMLTEINFGIFHAVPKHLLSDMFPTQLEEYQAMRRFNGKYFARRPGGESPMDVEIRQKLWLESLYRDISNYEHSKHIVIVGHGAQLTLLRKAIFHYSHDWYASEPNPENCSIQEVILESGCNIDKGYIYGWREED